MSTGFGLQPASGLPRTTPTTIFRQDLELAPQVLLLHRLEHHQYQRNEIIAFCQVWISVGVTNRRTSDSGGGRRGSTRSRQDRSDQSRRYCERRGPFNNTTLPRTPGRDFAGTAIARK